MDIATSSNALDLVDRLGKALAGTEGRQLKLGSMRSLVAMEVDEWRSETLKPDQSSEPVPSRDFVIHNKD